MFIQATDYANPTTPINDVTKSVERIDVNNHRGHYAPCSLCYCSLDHAARLKD